MRAFAAVLSLAIVTVGVWHGISIIRNLHPKPRTEVNGHYDYIIVGAGAAGSVLANRLSENPNITILVVEAGGDEQDPMYDIPWNAPSAQMTKADWMYYSEPQTHACQGMKEKRQYIPRGRGLGGSTLVNGLVYVRGSRYDYDEWAANGCSGWSYDEVLPYFKKSENIHIDALASSEYRSQGGPLSVSDTTISGITEKFLQAGVDMGYPIVDCNGNNGWQRGFSRMQAIVGKSVRWHTARAFLWPAMARSNLHVVTQAHTTKVVMDGKTAVGIEVIVQGRKKVVRATREVILSAGVIGSPQLLLLSGIGPKKHLQEMKIPLVADLPVGEGIQDHVMYFFKAEVNESISITPDKINSWWTWLQYHLFGTGYLATNAAVEATAWICTDPNHQTGSTKCPDVQFILFSSLAEHGNSYDHFNYEKDVSDEIYHNIHKSHGFTVAIEATHPVSRGTIRLQSRDPFDYPLIDVRYLEDPYDVKPIIRGVRFFQQLLQTKTMKGINAQLYAKTFSKCSSHKFDTDAYWECTVRHLAVSGYHHSASCRMGAASDPTAVVDPTLRVRGLRNLRVVDSSVFPSVTSGNTMAPTIMIAEKASDIIKETLR